MLCRFGVKMNKPEILTSLQKRFLGEIFSDPWFRRYFYLTGGTALASFYLHHRFSDDLDFFSHDVTLDSIPALIKQVGKKMGCPVQQVQTSPSFQRYLLDDELKLDVVADVGFRVGVPELIGDYMVDTLKNIAVNKVGCLLGRLDAKDFVDLYFILKREPYDIFELLTLGQQKDGGLEPFVWASLIAEVKRLAVLPRMIETLSLEELRKFFLELHDQILKSLKPEI